MRRLLLFVGMVLSACAGALGADLQLTSGRALTDAVVVGLDKTGRVKITYLFEGRSGKSAASGSFSQADFTPDSQLSVLASLGSSSNRWVDSFTAGEAPKAVVYTAWSSEERSILLEETRNALHRFIPAAQRNSTATGIVDRLSKTLGNPPFTPDTRFEIRALIDTKDEDKIQESGDAKVYLAWMIRYVNASQALIRATNDYWLELAYEASAREEKRERRASSAPDVNQQMELDSLRNQLRSQEYRQSGLQDEIDKLRRNQQSQKRDLDQTRYEQDKLKRPW